MKLEVWGWKLEQAHLYKIQISNNQLLISTLGFSFFLFSGGEQDIVQNQSIARAAGVQA
jgi:hypothetical protein